MWSSLKFMEFKFANKTVALVFGLQRLVWSVWRGVAKKLMDLVLSDWLGD